MELEKIISKIQAAKGKYYKLVLLAGPFAETNTKILKSLNERLNYPYVNFSLYLSAKLIDIPVNKRRSHIVNLLPNFSREFAEDVLLLDHPELLFLPGLGVDPLRALQSISRNKTIVAAWTGGFDGKKLTYASQGHPEYQRYQGLAEEDCTIVVI